MTKSNKRLLIFIAENGRTYDFKECYKILRSFYKKNNRTLYFIGLNDVYNNHPIGQIIKFLREKYKEHLLSSEKIEALEKMGMAWTNFEACYYVLRKYNYVTDCPISKIKRDDVFENVKIGVLIVTLRKMKKEGRLSRSQIKKLEDLGMTWEEKIENQQNLTDNPAKNGDFHSKIQNSTKNQALEKDKSQTSEINQDTNSNLICKMTSNKKSEKKKLQNKFSRIQVLIDYCEETNSKLSQINTEIFYNGVKLKTKISHLRTLNQNKELTEPEIEKLNELDMIWNVQRNTNTDANSSKIEKSNMSRIKPLIDYCQETHNDLSLIKFKDTYKGYKIGYQVHYLRSLRSQGKLPNEEIRELDKMNMSWSAFDIRCAVLKKFKETTHRELSSILYAEKFEEYWIGHLISELKTLRKEEKLSLSQIKRLDDLGFPWTKLERKKRNLKRLEPLIQYCKETGNTLASIKYNFVYKNQNLGTLINALRCEYKKGLLSKEDIELLESYGMIWSAKITFEKRILKLKTFVENGGVLADIRYCDELYVLIKTLRREKREGKLMQEQIAELNALGMVWSSPKKSKEELSV